ncbi:erythromycin esterase [Clostridium cavendishii DSM 21758]|uniref:Erythromycin esterase n=1 Tax=Clostridium cavendishii DSM 21758 TaxID=1121302 RepID=A0A1M6RBK1_9CLOT|nr:erythromycin esterase family protein [Clostridium cavendishii]SHK29790.1 erythromycin esterase [Clostridium cavendishii DSM 21758]
MRIKKSGLAFLLSVSMLFCNGGIVYAQTNDETKLNLKNNITPIYNIKAENGFEDLIKWKPILKDKKIIAVGEATHGTKEFSQIKHRMFEFLVEKMGYRLFAIEADTALMEEVNDYVLYNKGEPNEILKKFSWMLNTQEMLDMIKWMRNYNDNPIHKQKVKFYGMDMQSGPTAIPRVIEYIKNVDNENLENFERILNNVSGKILYTCDESTFENIKNQSIDLESKMEKNKDNYVKVSSLSEYELVKHHLSVLNQYIDITKIARKSISMEYLSKRDYYMAQNVKWILDHENEYGNDKIMLWAQNGHVSKKESNFIPMGENLKNIYGDKFYSIGLDFYEGTFKAQDCNNADMPLVDFKFDNSPEGTLVYEFAKTDLDAAFMDFKTASKNKDIKEWLSKSKLVHNVGWGFGEDWSYMYPEDVTGNYDGFIFFKKTSPVTVLSKTS